VGVKKTVANLAWFLSSVIFALYLGVLVFYKVLEKRILYSPYKFKVTPTSSTRPSMEEVEIESTDGVKLICYLYPLRSEDSASTWIIWFQGNSGSVVLNDRHTRVFLKLGINVLAVDYRGYGKSSGEPSESGLYDDAEASYNYLTKVRHISAKKIFLYGYSLGAGVVSNLATKIPAAGVILEAAYKSLPDLGKEMYPWLPADLLPVQRFDSFRRIDEIAMPKLFIHAIDDKRIPIAHGRALFEKATEPKSMVELRGGHDFAIQEDSVKYVAALRKFFQRQLP
jgi:dipeptidyl aminopeptidase/acylaminoacyl peptidase